MAQKDPRNPSYLVSCHYRRAKLLSPLAGVKAQALQPQLKESRVTYRPEFFNSIPAHDGGGGGFAVWDDYAEFPTLIQGLPQMTHLGLEWICILLPTSDGTASTSQTRFHHPNLRSLYLEAKAGRISKFLEFVPLQTLKRMEFEAECQNVSDIVGGRAEGVFRDFWGGWKGHRGHSPLFTGGCSGNYAWQVPDL
jgi:hypothetical protein